MESHLNLFMQVTLAIIGALISVIFNRIQKDLTRISLSIEDLSVKLAVLGTKAESHERRLNLLKKDF